ncbi:MAG TPA: amidase [Thermoleophilaceae bacterium]|nr:amidase [Thermoleophilaceae bacterium]
MEDLLTRPAGELARLIRDGEISSRELSEACLARIDSLNGSLNAFVHVDAEGALAAADAVQPGDPRPFAGVPIAIKDTAAVAGMPFTMASDIFGDFVPGHDSFAVRRLRAAGFVLVGKTNMPEFGIVPVSESRRFGPARNPWDPGRTPGGSSGGAAAAVAAGIVPLAHGSDGGGSIRIPAACCGLVGLKPTRGRISRGPEQGDDFLVQDGVLTRTVGETAELLDVIAGYETGDATWAPPPDEPFAALAAREPGRLRIGFTTEAPIEAPLDPECARAVSEAAELLESLGHEVEQASVPWSEQELLELFTLVFTTPIASGVFYGALVTGREPAEELVEPLSWTIWQGVRERSALDYLLARTQLTAFSRPIVALWDRYDVLLTPALAERPVPIGEIDTCSDDPWGDFRRSGRFTPYTAIFNVTGQPAVSLPLFHGDDGLPTCVQLAGRPAGEAALLSLAGQLEAARPWADRRPEPLVRDARP